MWAYSRKSLVADFMKLVLFLNLTVIERMNYGGFKILTYSLMIKRGFLFVFVFVLGNLCRTKLLI